ncbi:hypothetical protein BRD20_07725 [Halobacteriales archaeon SW_8_65_20]|nr:MAG: hypothetical protein BRD20_07725 [Halobacteriales archaeon SW_8_65_20]
MSDFDREKEREKLREKYEQDKQKREQSERLSELLLKGATMTDRHCETCGDPVFRWDGQEFCPTCQQPGEETTGESGPPAGTDEPNSPAPTDESAVEVKPDTEQPTESQPAVQPDRQPRQPTPRQPAETPDATGQPSMTAETGDLSAARASLERTLATLAQQAEQADTLAETRRYLDGARDAAEALDAAEQVR